VSERAAEDILRPYASNLLLKDVTWLITRFSSDGFFRSGKLQAKTSQRIGVIAGLSVFSHAHLACRYEFVGAHRFEEFVAWCEPPTTAAEDMLPPQLLGQVPTTSNYTVSMRVIFQFRVARSWSMSMQFLNV